jgi:hypothetical protein
MKSALESVAEDLMWQGMATAIPTLGNREKKI